MSLARLQMAHDKDMTTIRLKHEVEVKSIDKEMLLMNLTMEDKKLVERGKERDIQRRKVSLEEKRMSRRKKKDGMRALAGADRTLSDNPEAGVDTSNEEILEDDPPN